MRGLKVLQNILYLEAEIELCFHHRVYIMNMRVASSAAGPGPVCPASYLFWGGAVSAQLRRCHQVP